MTYEELIAVLDDLDIALSNGFGKASTFIACTKAVRKVIELHKPLYYRKGEIETKGAHCDECSKGSHGENAVEYPCPTIQAIESELNNG